MADPNNILRVGAEFDVAPLIENTAQAVASFDEMQAAFEQVAAVAEATGDTWTQNAAAIMAEGLSAADTTENLVRWGATQEQAATAVRNVTAGVQAQIPALASQSASVSVSTTATQANTVAVTANVPAQAAQNAQTAASVAPQAAKATATNAANAATVQQTATSSAAAAQIAALQAQVNALNAALVQLQQQLANTQNRTGGMTSAMGAARVEAGALTGSTGMMVGGLARVAAQSSLLAPIISAAFPVFAIVAFVAILDQAINKLMEWADEARKAADAQAEFDRMVQKSVDTMNTSGAALAGLSSRNAELAEKMAHTGEKSVDLSETIKKTNEQIDQSSQGIFKRLKEGSGILAVAIGESIGIIDKSERDLENWNSRINETTQHEEDLSKAVGQVTEQLKLLHIQQEVVAAEGDTRGVAEIQARIDAQTKLQTDLIARANTTSRQLIADQIKTDQTLLEDHAKMLSARAAQEESEARIELRAHAITLEQSRVMELDAAEKRRVADEEVLSSKINVLRRELAAGLITKQSEVAGIKELNAQIAEDEITAATKRANINAETDQKILREIIEVGEARINAEHTVTEAIDKLQEDRAKRELHDADTVRDVEHASTDIIKASTTAYEDQIKTLQRRAALLESTTHVLKGGVFVQPVTADLGTADFTKQIEQLKGVDDEKYRILVAFDAQVRALLTKETNDEENIAKERADKIKRIRETELSDQIAIIDKQLSTEQAKYSEEIAELDSQMSAKKGKWENYYSAVAALASKSYQTQIDFLQREATEVRAAAEAHTITEEQASKRLSEIYSREEKAFDEMEKREVEAAKRAVQQEETDIKSATEHITQSFTQAFNSVITGHERVGVAAMKLGAELESAIITRGIKVVVSHYAGQLLQIIAEHSAMIAKILGIHVAGSAAQNAIDAKQVATHETLEITQQAKDRAAQASMLAQYNTTQLQETTSLTTQTAQRETATQAETTAYLAAIAQRQTAEATATATGLAETIAANDTKIASEAGFAGAAAFASVMAALPFPVNVATAPEVMAAAVATALSNLALGSAEGGSFLEKDMIVAAHKNEMILPPSIATSIKGAVPAINTFNSKVSSTASSATGGTTNNEVHHHYNMPITINQSRGSNTPAELVAAVRKGIRMGH